MPKGRFLSEFHCKWKSHWRILLFDPNHALHVHSSLIPVSSPIPWGTRQPRSQEPFCFLRKLTFGTRFKYWVLLCEELEWMQPDQIDYEKRNNVTGEVYPAWMLIKKKKRQISEDDCITIRFICHSNSCSPKLLLQVIFFCHCQWSQTKEKVKDLRAPARCDVEVRTMGDWFLF